MEPLACKTCDRCRESKLADAKAQGDQVCDDHIDDLEVFFELIER